MEVNGHRPRHELEEGIIEGTVDILAVPSVIGGRIGEGKTSLKGVGKVVAQDRYPVLPHGLASLPDPLIALSVPLGGDGSQIDVSVSPESLLFGLDAVGHQGLHGIDCRGIQAGHTEQAWRRRRLQNRRGG